MPNKEYDIQELIQKTNQLIEEKERIIKILKEKHKEACDWFEKNKIDLRTLGKYAKQITLVFVMALGLISSSVDTKAVEIVDQPAEVMVLNSDRLRQISGDEKLAYSVWNKYRSEIVKSSFKYGVDPRVIFSTIMVESMGNSNAIRHEPQINDASYGLGQLLYSTAKMIGYSGSASGLYDPATNIDLIARYHKRNLDVYGKLSVSQLAIAYNTGSPYATPYYGHVEKFNKWFNIIDNLMRS